MNNERNHNQHDHFNGMVVSKPSVLSNIIVKKCALVDYGIDAAGRHLMTLPWIFLQHNIPDFPLMEAANYMLDEETNRFVHVWQVEFPIKMYFLDDPRGQED